MSDPTASEIALLEYLPEPGWGDSESVRMRATLTAVLTTATPADQGRLLTALCEYLIEQRPTASVEERLREIEADADQIESSVSSLLSEVRDARRAIRGGDY